MGHSRYTQPRTGQCVTTPTSSLSCDSASPHPHNRYDFVPPVKYNYLDADEAEERFERRTKTLNYFSIMMSRKLKDPEEGEEGTSVVSGEGKDLKPKEKKKPSADSGLVSIKQFIRGYKLLYQLFVFLVVN